MRARVDAAHRAAPVENSAKDLELRRTERTAEVADLEPEPHVGPVGPEARDRLVVRHARKRRPELHPTGRERCRHHALGDAHHVLLLDEGHLQVELRELELAVGAQRLVPEAARDLVVALEAGDHQELLEQLGRLRQRIEAAVLQAAGNHEVARPLGSRARQDRRLEVEEAGLVEEVADRARDVVAQLERALHRVTAQVEVAVAQAQRLVHRRVLVDRERRRLGAPEHLVVRRRGPRPRPSPCRG